MRDVTDDYEGFRFNTMVAKLMELTNTLMRYRGTEVAARPRVGRGGPAAAADAGAGGAAHHRGAVVAPAGRGAARSGRRSTPRRWPEVDPSAIVDETREVPIQVNGKVRDRVTVPVGIEPAELERVVLARVKIRALLAGRKPDRVIHAGGGAS